MRRLVVLLAVTATACGAPVATMPSESAGETAAAGATSPADGATTVDVTLKEFAVFSVDSAPAGEVTFNVTNGGPDEVHEFVVIATDLAPGGLPTDERGAVDEEGDGIEVVGEIGILLVGETQQLTVDLAAGSYVLVCNISDGVNTPHYQFDMYTSFEATD